MCTWFYLVGNEATNSGAKDIRESKGPELRDRIVSREFSFLPFGTHLSGLGDYKLFKMFIKLRGLDGKQIVITVSKTETIASLKSKVEEEFGISKSKQRLFFSGKQLEDGYKLFDYKINVNDTVQVMEKPDVEVTKDADEKEKQADEVPCDSPYFNIGSVVDACDATFGAWFEGKVVEIVTCPPDAETTYFKIQFLHIPTAPTLVTLQNVRPLSRKTIPTTSLKENDMVMVNYNLENPQDRGYWYDMKIKKVGVDPDENTFVLGTLYAGVDRTPMDDMRVIFPDEIMEVCANKLMTERTPEELQLLTSEPAYKRKTAPLCDTCKDNPRRKCKQCGCDKCGGKEEPAKQIVCDECECAYHIWCLNPPLEELPDCEDWYCNKCRNDDKEVVKAGEKLKASSKKAKMASSNPKSNRDWGRGMACVGRTKVCTLVPRNHFGPIPGVEVGTMWKYRFQVAESGVHRTQVAGIHGRDKEGAFSIALSGGYEDDVDNGDEFLYTGSGGRDLSGNKRTAEQSWDQLLTRMNKALAKNCNAKLSEEGAESVDWKNGKPVRVVRNYNLAKHSKYAPEEGNRYDGIYKVVKYYKETGQSGFKVWRYLLRRDDPIPAPWTEEGEARIASLGLREHFLETCKVSPTGRSKEGSAETKRKRGKGKPEEEKTAKKIKISYALSEDVMKAVSADQANAKIWENLKKLTSKGQKVFLDKWRPPAPTTSVRLASSAPSKRILRAALRAGMSSEVISISKSTKISATPCLCFSLATPPATSHLGPVFDKCLPCPPCHGLSCREPPLASRGVLWRKVRGSVGEAAPNQVGTDPELKRGGDRGAWTPPKFSGFLRTPRSASPNKPTEGSRSHHSMLKFLVLS
ncbi:hypothetical protein GE061_010644 [Apolygus lucorum]|uniref:RING-type E3 ubiquitin transferase n=1 Tax=Apolygus lucorum TaxID=248454 RepID=A0A8S9XV46_APOLU|nr:hypothetical protein GE061_010644 [Apolygus lucorum]